MDDFTRLSRADWRFIRLFSDQPHWTLTKNLNLMTISQSMSYARLRSWNLVCALRNSPGMAADERDIWLSVYGKEALNWWELNRGPNGRELRRSKARYAEAAMF